MASDAVTHDGAKRIERAIDRHASTVERCLPHLSRIADELTRLRVELERLTNATQEDA